MNNTTFGLSTIPLSAITKDSIVYEIKNHPTNITEEQYKELFNSSFGEATASIIELLVGPLVTDNIKLGLLPALSLDNSIFFGKALNLNLTLKNENRIIPNLILVINRRLNINLKNLLNYDHVIEGLIKKSESIDSRIRFFLQLSQNEYALRYIVSVVFPKMLKEIQGYNANTVINIIKEDRTYQISNIITNLVKSDIYILFEGLRIGNFKKENYLTFYKLLTPLARQTIVNNLEIPERIKLFNCLQLIPNEKNSEYTYATELISNITLSKITSLDFTNPIFIQNLLAIFSDLPQNMKDDLFSSYLTEFLEVVGNSLANLDNIYAEYFLSNLNDIEIQKLFTILNTTTKSTILSKLSSSLKDRINTIIEPIIEKHEEPEENEDIEDVVEAPTEASKIVVEETKEDKELVSIPIEQFMTDEKGSEELVSISPKELTDEEDMEEELVTIPLEEFTSDVVTDEEKSQYQKEVDELFSKEELDKGEFFAALKDSHKVDLIIEKIKNGVEAGKLIKLLSTFEEEELDMVNDILYPKLS